MNLGYDIKEWPVSKKENLKSLIRNYLQRLNPSIIAADKDVLPEYILVMVNNKKAGNQIIQELIAFLGENDAKLFTEWLWETLSKPDLPNTLNQDLNKTEDTTIRESPSKPALQSVVGYAPSIRKTNSKEMIIDSMESNGDTKKRKSIRKSKLDDDGVTFKITLNGAQELIRKSKNELKQQQQKQNKEDTEKIEMDNEEFTSNKKPKKVVKCTYWPNCSKGDSCPFHHPTELCKNFPNCTFGTDCLYIHPAVEHKPNYYKPVKPFTPSFLPEMVPCKFGFACSTPGCLFTHPKESCKFGNKCLKGPACSFSHAPPCRFGVDCRTPNCTFAHPSPQPIMCKFGERCSFKNTSCKFLHSKEEENSSIQLLSSSLPKTPPREVQEQS